MRKCYALEEAAQTKCVQDGCASLPVLPVLGGFVGNGRRYTHSLLCCVLIRTDHLRLCLRPALPTFQMKAACRIKLKSLGILRVRGTFVLAGDLIEL